MDLQELKSNNSFRIFLEASLILVLVTSFFVMTQNDEPASASEASTTDTTGITTSALKFYLRVTGYTQGEIKGDVTQAGREDLIEGVQYSHSVYHPTDAAGGLPLSRRIHTPVTTTIRADSSTPLLYAAFGNGEMLSEVMIYFWRPTTAGPEEQYFTVKLEDAHIVSLYGFQQHTYNIESYHPHFGLEVSFVYDHITWSWTDPSTDFQDTWDPGPES